MLSLLVLYKWTILAGVLTAPTLALLGAQLATRDRGMQTLCVGQGAMVGVLLGIGLLHSLEGTLAGTIGPFVTAVILSAITYLTTDLVVAKRAASKNTHFAFIFALLLAAGYLIGSLFPALESHMAQIYFGDLATLTEGDSKVASVASLISLLILTFGVKPITNQSFELAIFGGNLTEQGRGQTLAFKVISLVTLCLSVQFVGFLFTVAMLFLPTGLMTFMKRKGLKSHLVFSVAISAIATLVGFVISLHYTRVPTVPAIVMVSFLLALVVLASEKTMELVRAKTTTAPRLEESLAKGA